MAAAAQQAPPPDVPANLRAPAGEKLIFQAHAVGSQIYVCQAGADQKVSWVLKGPEADLLDASGAIVGHHSAGPSWKHKDGSEVTAKVISREDAPEPDAIPWLLLRVTGRSGSGVLSAATTIQRIHTMGGQPQKSESCEPSTQGKETKSQYSADYVFYAPGP